MANMLYNLSQHYYTIVTLQQLVLMYNWSSGQGYNYIKGNLPELP